MDSRGISESKMVNVKKILQKDDDGKWRTLSTSDIEKLSSRDLEGLVIQCGAGNNYKLVKI